MEQHTAETLKSLAVTTIRSIRQTVATLSGGQRQSVAVARAVMWNSKLVVLDEPTAALGVAQTEQVLELVRRLGSQGLGVMLISHNLHDVFETADRIAVLRLGRTSECSTAATRRSRQSSRQSRPACPRRSPGSRPRGRGSGHVSPADIVGADRRRRPARGRAASRGIAALGSACG